MIALNERLDFYFPLQAISLTLASFLLLFVLISLFISAVLRSDKLITLIKSDRQPKKEPKASLLLSLLVVALIGISYFLSLRAEGLEAILLLLPVVIMITIATYLLFTQLSVYIIRRLKSRERFFWFRTNMLLFSDLSYRMKDNARTFFWWQLFQQSPSVPLERCTASSRCCTVRCPSIIRICLLIWPGKATVWSRRMCSWSISSSVNRGLQLSRLSLSLVIIRLRQGTKCCC